MNHDKLHYELRPSSIDQCYGCESGAGHDCLVKFCPLHAAAPELLEALKGLMTHYIGNRSSENVVGEAGLAADAARAAIAKAERRS